MIMVSRQGALHGPTVHSVQQIPTARRLPAEETRKVTEPDEERGEDAAGEAADQSEAEEVVEVEVAGGEEVEFQQTGLQQTGAGGGGGQRSRANTSGKTEGGLQRTISLHHRR